MAQIVPLLKLFGTSTADATTLPREVPRATTSKGSKNKIQLDLMTSLNGAQRGQSSLFAHWLQYSILEKTSAGMASFMEILDMQLCSCGVNICHRVARIPARMTVTATPMARMDAKSIGSMKAIVKQPGKIATYHAQPQLRGVCLCDLQDIDSMLRTQGLASMM
mmetsp:Transcript_39811/g.92146  ORF Transcript_39811/g.92146 Transcript_39811/m.92146 type:complete len:164 (+) Transcript_39811:974-1465(+)